MRTIAGLHRLPALALPNALAIAIALSMPMAVSGAPNPPMPDFDAAADTAAAADSSGGADTAAARQPGASITFSAVLQVEEAGKVADELVLRTESLGGWFSRRTKSSLELRLPTSLADSFISGLEGLGVLLDRNLTTRNLDGERSELQSRLKARKAMLQDYYAMLKESGDSTVFTIQSEIVSLQTEIEQTAASILKLEDSMAYATLTLNFRFQERMAPITTGASRFRWLNRLDIPSMRERFDYETISH